MEVTTTETTVTTTTTTYDAVGFFTDWLASFPNEDLYEGTDPNTTIGHALAEVLVEACEAQEWTDPDELRKEIIYWLKEPGSAPAIDRG